MPWDSGKAFAERHNKKLKGAAATKAAHMANAMIREGTDEGIAIATASKYGNKMARKHLAVGGLADGMQGGWHQRNQADPLLHGGLVPGPTGGRADALDFSVPTGAYVLPSDVVSAIGDGNTQSGGRILDQMLNAQEGQGFAAGGAPGLPVPVKLSGGEYLVSPQQVAQIGGGDIKHGHDILDKFVTQTRDQHIKTLKKLPGPVK